jgi:hypothetical protein
MDQSRLPDKSTDGTKLEKGASFARYLHFLAKPKNQFALLIILLAISRVAFLGTGYGVDPDAWRVALTAEHIADTGEYRFSREPGYPLHEMASALLIRGGPAALNGATAVFSVLAALLFAMTLRYLGIKDYLLGGLAMGLVPIVYENSIVTMDYLWALAFMMAALYSTLQRRFLLAGVLLGCAIGCRLTSGVLIIPLAIIAGRDSDNPYGFRSLSPQLKLASASLLVGSVSFLPVFLQYGLSSLRFYDTASPPVADVCRRAAIDVWGTFGVVIIGLAAAGIALFPGWVTPGHNRKNRNHSLVLRSSWVAITLFAVAFLRLPHEAGYLIPVVPFVLLVLALNLKRRLFMALCLVILASPFLTFGASGSVFGLRAGPLLHWQRQRVKNYEYIHSIVTARNTLPDRSVIVVAWWQPQVLALQNHDQPGDREFVYYLNEQRLQYWLDRDYTVFYVQDVADHNLRKFGVDLAAVGTLLDIDP